MGKRCQSLELLRLFQPMRERERKAVSFSLGSRVSLVKEDATEVTTKQLMFCQEYGQSKRLQLLSSDGVNSNGATVFLRFQLLRRDLDLPQATNVDICVELVVLK